MRTVLSVTFLSVILYSSSVAQRGLTDDVKETEEQIKASTKQINQFFRRFNGEESESGERYYEGDKEYHNISLRKRYLPNLFDSHTDHVSSGLTRDFLDDVIDRKNPEYLSFHSDKWLAEVNAIFRYKGKEQSVLLYMKLQQQGKGYEWVIDDIAFEPFKKMFNKDTSETKKFIHPMSHELDFMTLRKAFQNSNNPESFTSRDYQPDYLTLFLYEIKKGNLQFKTIKNVKFHFFEIDGWYFEISNFNRPGYNSGWLISNLVKANNKEKELLKAYIYDKN